MRITFCFCTLLGSARGGKVKWYDHSTLLGSDHSTLLGYDHSTLLGSARNGKVKWYDQSVRPGLWSQYTTGLWSKYSTGLCSGRKSEMIWWKCASWRGSILTDYFVAMYSRDYPQSTRSSRPVFFPPAKGVFEQTNRATHFAVTY